MVKYAENWFESLINKLVLLSLLAIIVMLLLDFVFKNPVLEPYYPVIDIVINSIFIIDLAHIFRKRVSLGSFLYHNWLDIIACIPLNQFFRAAKLIRLTRISKLVTRQGKAVKLLPQAARLKRLTWIQGLKIFSKETEVDKHIDYTKDKIFDLKLMKLDHELNKIYTIITEKKF